MALFLAGYSRTIRGPMLSGLNRTDLLAIMRTRRILLLILAASLMPVGCHKSIRSLAKASTGQLQPPVVPPRDQPLASPTVTSQAASANPLAPAPASPLVEPTREQAFQQVLGDLQSIGRENPAAQQALLAQLESADPAHWPALVQRARSTMAYQQQIAARSPTPQVLPASTHSHAEDQGVTRQDPQEPAQDIPPREPPVGAGLHSASATSSLHRTDQAMQDPAVQLTSATMEGVGPAASPTPYPATPHQQATLAHRKYATQAEDGFDASLDRSIDLLSAQLSDQPQSLGEAYDHVRLRLLQLAAGDLDSAASPPVGLTATEQRFWSNQILALSTLLDHRDQPDSRRRAAAGGLHLAKATEALEQLGSLTLSNLEFCREVYGFGAYKALDSAEFRPGEEVKVYVEVSNYKSIQTPDGMHTSLATSYEVLDQQGNRVDGGEVPLVTDYCARRRHDFHIQYGITLPQGIYPGRYLLKLTLTDQLGDKIGHGALDFEIAVGDPQRGGA